MTGPAPRSEVVQPVTQAATDDRVERLLAALDLDQRVALAMSEWDRLADVGIPALRYADGPNGVRGTDGATAFPSGLSLAATFDEGLAEAYGRAIGAEIRSSGHNVWLGPGLDIARVPGAGRVSESLGEDPMLTGRLGAAMIRGARDAAVAAVPKHYLANNFEIGRTGVAGIDARTPAVDVRIDPEALRDVYLPPFLEAVTAGAAGVMGSYNQVNGQPACQNRWLLDLLKVEAGWRGAVVPDFLFAVRDPVAAALAGVDIPGLDERNGRMREQLLDGTVPAARLDDICRRVLWLMIASGILDATTSPLDPAALGGPTHLDLATRVAADGMVLLRNDGVLPIAPSVRSIAVIGPAGADAQYVVGGSASVTILPSRRSEPLAAIRTRAGAAVTVEHAQGALADVPLPAVPPSRWMTPDGTPGVRASYWAGPSLTGEPAFTRREPTIEVVGTPPGLPESWSARWAARLVPRLSGSHRISLALAGIATVRIDGRQLLHGAREAVAFMGPACPLTGTTELVAGVPVSVEVEYVSGAAIVAPPVELLGPTVVLGWLEPDDSLDAAVATAARSDVAVVVVGFPASEGMDRTSLALPADQDELVRAVAAVNPRTVVVLNGGGPALTPWIGDVAAAIVAWLPGERFGAALAAVLFGDLDPGGRLPITFPCDDDQGPLAGHPERYPGVDGVCRYDEGPLVGYRWFDTMEEIPRFPFGHGGSYATVEHGPVSAELDDGDVVVRVRARNVSAREGSSRLQLYAESTGVPGAPRRTLVDVAVLRLGPGEEGIVELRAPRRVLEPPATEGGAVVTEVPVRATLWVGTSSASFLASIATVGAEHGLRVHASTPP